MGRWKSTGFDLITPALATSVCGLSLLLLSFSLFLKLRQMVLKGTWRNFQAQHWYSFCCLLCSFLSRLTAFLDALVNVDLFEPVSYLNYVRTIILAVVLSRTLLFLGTYFLLSTSILRYCRIAMIIPKSRLDRVFSFVRIVGLLLCLLTIITACGRNFQYNFSNEGYSSGYQTWIDLSQIAVPTWTLLFTICDFMMNILLVRVTIRIQTANADLKKNLKSTRLTLATIITGILLIDLICLAIFGVAYLGDLDQIMVSGFKRLFYFITY